MRQELLFSNLNAIFSFYGTDKMPVGSKGLTIYSGILFISGFRLDDLLWPLMLGKPKRGYTHFPSSVTFMVLINGGNKMGSFDWWDRENRCRGK